MANVDNANVIDKNNQRHELETTLERLGRGSKFLWLIFVLTVTPAFHIGFHSSSYIFLAEVPTYWCTVPELSAANWTDSQIRNVSSATSCTKYSYDYTYLAELAFEDALEYAEANRAVATEKCTEFSYADDIDGTSIVTKWDLVCDRTALRSSVQMALSLGKFAGAGVFGMIADRFGRRVSYVFGILLLIVCGPTTAIAPWYWLFIVMRILTGISIMAIYCSSFTILMEVAGPSHRDWMGVVHNIGQPMGMMMLAGIAYMTKTWQALQLSISLPAILLLLYAWFMPESPRWLLAQGRYAEAKLRMEQIRGPLFRVDEQPNVDTKKSENDNECTENASVVFAQTRKKIWQNLKDTLVIYTNSELRKRAFIGYVNWAACVVTYYVIALNVDNFSANRYLYIFLTGLAELPAYVIPLPLLTMGRRLPTSLLFLGSGVALLCILLIPQTNTVAIMALALLGRLPAAAVYSVLILHTSELFPTVARNGAIGTSSTMSHIGGLSAPYIADLLGAEAWWAPSTFCGITAVVAGALCLLLPETRGRPLADTVEEELSEERGRVSLRNCFSCK